MPRMRIELPALPVFHTDLQVRITDVNYGGHLGNDQLLGLLHEARIRWLRSLGQSEADVGDGAGLLMVNAAIQYLRQARAGDALRAGLLPCETSRSGFTLYYELCRPADDAVIARAFTVLTCFDYTAQRPVRIPPHFASRLASG